MVLTKWHDNWVPLEMVGVMLATFELDPERDPSFDTSPGLAEYSI